MELRDVVKSPESYGSTLLLAVLDRYGTEALAWEPETLRLQLQQDKCPLDPDNEDKLQAAISLLTTNLFHVSLEGFNLTCRALSGESVDSRWFVPATVDEAAWGVLEARLIEGPENFDTQEFSKDIEIFVGTILSDEGIYKAPPILSFAIFDPKWEANARGVLGVDPMMMEASESTQNEKLQQVEEGLIAHMTLLADQLYNLELRDGDAKEPAEVLLKLLEEKQG